MEWADGAWLRGYIRDCDWGWRYTHKGDTHTHTHTHKIYTHKRLFLERDSCMHVERFLNKLL